MEYVLQRGMTPETTYTGGKLVMMRVRKGLDITLLDTLRFMPLPLDALPSAFGIDMQKGNLF